MQVRHNYHFSFISRLISVCKCRHNSKSYSDHHTCPLIVDHPASVKSIILVAGPRRVQSGICLQQVGASCRIITSVASSLQRPIGCIDALVPPVLHDPSLPITLFDDPVGESLILFCRQIIPYYSYLPNRNSKAVLWAQPPGRVFLLEASCLFFAFVHWRNASERVIGRP